MTGVRREERGAQGVPSATLLRLNRHLLPNVLVVGGSPRERVTIVRALHRQSPISSRAVCAVESSSDLQLLERTLLSWLGHSSRPPELDCEHGMLFVDDLAALPGALQRLLAQFSRRVEGVPAALRRGPGPVRLAAGSASDPADEVARGRLLPDLYDALEKLSIHLGPRSRGTAPRQPRILGSMASLIPAPRYAVSR